MNNRICPRCLSRMHQECYFTESGTWEGWHCVICGNVDSQTIRANRLNPWKSKKYTNGTGANQKDSR